jgi:hypothetical protein
LRPGGLLAWLLRHQALVNSDQRLPVGAIEDIDPPGLPGLCDAFAGLTVDNGVEEHDRARRIVVPEVMAYVSEPAYKRHGFLPAISVVRASLTISFEALL